METGGMSSTTMARFIVRAVLSPPFSRAERQSGHCASAPGGIKNTTAATARSAAEKSRSFLPLPFIITTSLGLARGRFRRRRGGAHGAQAVRAEAVGEDYEEEADADDGRRHEREHEAHALELKVHEVGDDQRRLYDREPHQNRQHYVERHLHVREEDL